MFVFAGDLGYYCTKGVNKYRNTVLFPSAVGRGFKKEHPRYLGGNFGEGADNGLTLDNLYIKIDEGGIEREFFVGDLAQAELKNPVYPFKENKIHQLETKALLAALTLLMGKDTHDTELCFATGLPFKHFGPQKRELESFLNDLDFHVWFEYGEASVSKRVKFSRVILFPQGAGAVWYASLKNPQIMAEKGSLLGLIDIGGKTTEAILFGVTRQGLVLRENYSDTFDIGTTMVNDDVYRSYHKQTGSILSDADLRELVRRGYIKHFGEKLIFEKEIETARESLFETLMNEVIRRWGAVYRQINSIVFVGGGASDMSRHITRLRNAVIAENPQFANAFGYLMVAETVLSNERV